MDGTSLTGLPAHRLARLLRAGEVSAREVLDAHLRRIDEVNPRLNAVVQLAGDAQDRAREADAALARGEPPGPLHGVPFTAKDNLETRGVVTAIGVPRRAGLVPAEDATAVARLRAAGGILLGKANCPPWGAGLETDNPLYGRTGNPYDLDRTPGGSSGGEAAAVAAGCSPCGLGTDSGGSLQVPAHFCGVATLKPTNGLVPVAGVVDDEGPIGALSDPRTQVGPVARTVEDLVLLLRRWDRYRGELQADMAAHAYDAILWPVFSCPAPPHGDTTRPALEHAVSYTTPWSMAGWPCVVTRCGSAGGLPVGVQVVAGPWREDVALAVACRLEATLGGWRPPPI